MNFFGCHERSPVKVIVQRNILNLGDMRIRDQDRQGLHPILDGQACYEVANWWPVVDQTYAGFRLGPSGRSTKRPTSLVPPCTSRFVSDRREAFEPQLYSLVLFWKAERCASLFMKR